MIAEGKMNQFKIGDEVTMDVLPKTTKGVVVAIDPRKNFNHYGVEIESGCYWISGHNLERKVDKMNISKAIQQVIDGTIEKATRKTDKSIYIMTKARDEIKIIQELGNGITLTSSNIPYDGWQAEEKAMTFMEAWEWMKENNWAEYEGSSYKIAGEILHRFSHIDAMWKIAKFGGNMITGKWYKTNKED